MTIYQGIYIPVRGPPEVKIINASFEEICRLLQCSRDWHITIHGLSDFNLALLYDDDADIKRLPNNPLASRLVHQWTGRDNLPPIQGPVLLVDDRRKLTLDNLRYLLKRVYDKERIENTDKKMSELRKFYMELRIKNTAPGTAGTIIRTGSY